MSPMPVKMNTSLPPHCQERVSIPVSANNLILVVEADASQDLKARAFNNTKRIKQQVRAAFSC